MAQAMKIKVVKNTVNVGVARLMKMNSVVKQDLTEEFETDSWRDIKDKIINLSKKSGLRKLNALNVAKEVRKRLQ